MQVWTVNRPNSSSRFLVNVAHQGILGDGVVGLEEQQRSRAVARAGPAHADAGGGGGDQLRPARPDLCGLLTPGFVAVFGYGWVRQVDGKAFAVG